MVRADDGGLGRDQGGKWLAMQVARDSLTADLRRVGDGDVQAFIRVYNATSRKLFGIVVRILGRDELAAEVLQEVYLKVWQRAREFDPAQASPITWLATIARNRALDEARRRQVGSIEDMPEVLEMPSEEDVAGGLLARDEMHRLAECLDRLDAPRRDLVRLVYFEGLSRESAAERIGHSVSTVKTWLRQGLAQLKGCLEP